MITLLTGAPGHGKSFSAVKVIDETVGAGKPCATNVPLRSDWAEVMAKRRTLFWRWRKKALAEKTAALAGLVHVSDDLDEILRVRFAGKGEGRGLIVLDEAHRWLNTRAWDQAPGMKRDEAIAARLRVVGYCSGHRHYGADILLISQNAANIDAQVRSLYEFHSEVRNLRRLPIVGVLLRLNLFLRVTYWNDKARTKAGVSCYFLSKSLARLYDTHALQEHDWPVDAIVLPRPGPGADGGAAVPRTASSPPVASEPAGTGDVGARPSASLPTPDDLPVWIPGPDAGTVPGDQAGDLVTRLSVAPAEAEPRP